MTRDPAVLLRRAAVVAATLLLALAVVVVHATGSPRAHAAHHAVGAVLTSPGTHPATPGEHPGASPAAPVGATGSPADVERAPADGASPSDVVGALCLLVLTAVVVLVRPGRRPDVPGRRRANPGAVRGPVTATARAHAPPDLLALGVSRT